MEQQLIIQALTQQELQKQELKNFVTGEEKRFTVALSDKRIMESELDELKQSLRYVMVKVGLRANNIPEGEEKVVLIEHVITNYGNHTPQEIRLAFDMAISGKLDIDEKNVVCYENFSCLYFSLIMNSYRRWASQTHNQIITDVPAIEDKKELTEEDYRTWVDEWVESDNIQLELIPFLFYGYLIGTGDLEVNEEEKYYHSSLKLIKSKMIKEIGECKTTNALIDFNEFESMEREGCFSGKFKDRLIALAQKMAVYNYLMVKKNKKDDLPNLQEG